MQDDDDDESDVAVVHDEDEEDDDEDEEEEAHGLVSVENVVTDGANGSSGSSRLVGDWASLLVSNMSSVKPAESKGIMALAAAPQSMRSVYMGASVLASVSTQSSQMALAEWLLSKSSPDKREGASASVAW